MSLNTRVRMSSFSRIFFHHIFLFLVVVPFSRHPNSFFVSSSIFSAYFFSPKQNSFAMNSMTSFSHILRRYLLLCCLSSSSFTSEVFDILNNLSIITFSKSKTVLTSRSSNASSRYKQSSFLSASEIFIVVVFWQRRGGQVLLVLIRRRLLVSLHL